MASTSTHHHHVEVVFYNVGITRAAVAISLTVNGVLCNKSTPAEQSIADFTSYITTNDRMNGMNKFSYELYRSLPRSYKGAV